jgi:hypothetical protein
MTAADAQKPVLTFEQGWKEIQEKAIDKLFAMLESDKLTKTKVSSLPSATLTPLVHSSSPTTSTSAFTPWRTTCARRTRQ